MYGRGGQHTEWMPEWHVQLLYVAHSKLGTGQAAMAYRATEQKAEQQIR